MNDEELNDLLPPSRQIRKEEFDINGEDIAEGVELLVQLKMKIGEDRACRVLRYLLDHVDINHLTPRVGKLKLIE